MKPGRKSRFKNAYVWWVVLFIFVIGVSFKLPVGQHLNIALAPFIKVMQTPARWYQDFSLWFESAEALQADYRTLKLKTEQQDALSQELQVLQTENTQLRQLLHITQTEGYVWRVAKVISRGQEKNSQHLMLQIESAQEDDVIVSHEGLVGLVDKADKTYAVVRTILDASLAVPVTMFGSNLAGLVRGDGQHLLVDFIPLNKVPKVGDILITSGAGGIFPAGLPVAKVEKVRAIEGGIFAEVFASPVAFWQREAWLAVANRPDAK